MTTQTDTQSFPQITKPMFSFEIDSAKEAKEYLSWKNKLNTFDQLSPTDSQYIEYARQIKLGRGQRYLKKLTDILQTDKILKNRPKSILPKWSLMMLQRIFGYKILRNTDHTLESLLYITAALSSTVIFSVIVILIKVVY